ncbi:MAG: glutathione synthase [Gammaproteobacteria bacterium]
MTGGQLHLGVIMDPIDSIHPEKDTTLLLLEAAQRVGFRLSYFEISDIYAKNNGVWGRGRPLRVSERKDRFFEFDGDPEPLLLTDLSVLLMRKDPPVDLEYGYVTLLLALAEQAGLWILNSPRALLNTNEKLAILAFPDLAPPTLVTRSMAQLLEFIDLHGQAVLKPLDGMGGSRIFVTSSDDLNRHVIVETLTAEGSRYIMAQRFIPEIREGDKRILLIDGIPIPFALARIPKTGESRGNLARGGTPRGVPLTERDREICATVGSRLVQQGLAFVGLDVIGNYLTEINVTSPTCARELETAYDLDIGGQIMRRIIEVLKTRRSTSIDTSPRTSL